MNKRNMHAPEFKLKVILEVLREEKTLSQIAQHYSVHPNLVSKWKQEFLEHSQGAFRRGKTQAEKELKIQKERTQELEVIIGQLTYKVNWLKKKSAQFGIKIKED